MVRIRMNTFLQSVRAMCCIAALSMATSAHAGVTNTRPTAPLGNSDLQVFFANTPSDSPPGAYVNGPVIDPVADQSSFAVFTNTASGGSIVTFALEQSGAANTNQVGIYDLADPTKKALVFDGSKTAGDQTLVTFTLDGRIEVLFADSGITGFSGNFGFYLDVYDAAVGVGGDGDASTYDYTVYSEDSLNPGAEAQALIYRGNDLTTLQLPGFTQGVFSDSTWLIAFEDGLVGGPSGGSSDRDYSDLVIMMESIEPPLSFCGDGIVDAGEDCDDGNTDDTDGCRNDCTVSSCGDGIVDPGEDCDDGNSDDTDACRNDCTSPVCGDGIVDAGEDCDDGNSDDTDACRNDCTAPFCGDGILDAGEECDDGNLVDGDGCSANCDVEVTDCGPCRGKVTTLTLQYNGSAAAFVEVVQKRSTTVFAATVLPGGQFTFSGADRHGTLGTEISVYVDGALHVKIHTSCSQPIGPGLVFGDFLVIAGASRDGGALCPDDTPPGECGDGVLDSGEQCDDGNLVDGDGCSANCTVEDTGCAPCKGKVTTLTFQYNGAFAAFVEVDQKKPKTTIFADDLQPGDQFTVFGADRHGTMSTEIKIFVDGSHHVTIHTSCSQPIGPGMIFGDFEVLDGASKSGGLLCTVNP